MRMFFAACAIALLVGAPAVAQQFPPAQVTPHVQVQTIPPSLNGTWRVPIQLIASHDATLTLSPGANNRITGVYNSISRNEQFSCRGRYNRAKFAVFCESDTLQSVHTFYFVGEAQAVAPEGATRRSQFPARTRLTGQVHLAQIYTGAPPGHTVSIPFEGT